MAETTERDPTEAEGRKIKIAQNPMPPDEIFVDGVSRVLARPGLIKLDCYRVLRIDREDNAEVRTMSHRIVMPAGAIPELVRMFQNLAERTRQAQGEAGTEEVIEN